MKVWWIRDLIRNDKLNDIFSFQSFGPQKKVLAEIKGKKEEKFSGQSVSWNTSSCDNRLEYLQKNWLKLFLIEHFKQYIFYSFNK